MKTKDLKQPILRVIFIWLSLGSYFVNAGDLPPKAELGQKLYFDQNLSLNRSQSCATCHNPATGFVDQRDYTPNKAAHLNGVVSLGDDGRSFGDRTAPTAAYANQIPPFHINKEGKYIGGQFWDGRASTLIDQAKGPPLNPIEMGAPDTTFIKQRLLENPDYIASFKAAFGDSIFEDPEALYNAMAESIAAFEQTDFFSPFDSKYDRYLHGEYTLTSQEDLGMTLFFSQQFTNCNQCHQLKASSINPKETFSDYSYHNIGTPVNAKVRKYNKADAKTVDFGLFHHPEVNDPSHKGKFKVPTLRNIAVTGPYMHNGVFKELRTVVAFYNKYNSKSPKRQINPETGEQWAAPEVQDNLSMKELEHGPALDDKRIDALVAFMRTLTDQRYEHLLVKQ